jgi:hypothetical protein
MAESPLGSGVRTAQDRAPSRPLPPPVRPLWGAPSLSRPRSAGAQCHSTRRRASRRIEVHLE